MPARGVKAGALGAVVYCCCCYWLQFSALGAVHPARGA
ncbi:hypothetical protein A2U01_0102010, partial [Trifolium medium]|nr:hypothetical protein [Trifolium medium]